MMLRLVLDLRLTLDTQTVTVLQLRPGFVTSARVPEDVNSVVLGNPAFSRQNIRTLSHASYF